jgi:hypothetical protein
LKLLNDIALENLLKLAHNVYHYLVFKKCKKKLVETEKKLIETEKKLIKTVKKLIETE